VAKGDDRATVGASGKPEPGMILTSGTKDVAKAIGYKDAPSKGGNPKAGVKFKFHG
jgi:hypothetical protein